MKERKPNNVMWTSGEKMKLAKEVFNILKTRNISELRAINIAQEYILDNDRTRKIVGKQSIPWLKPLLEDISREFYSEYKTPTIVNALKELNTNKSKETLISIESKQIETPKPIEISIEAPIENSEVIEYLGVIETPKNALQTNVLLNPEKSPFEVKLHVLTPEELHRIIDTTIERYQSSLSIIIENTINKLSLPETVSDYIIDTLEDKLNIKKSEVVYNKQLPITIRKKMILLVNLLPIQQQEIKNDFSDIYDIRTWNKNDAGMDQLKSLCSNSKYIYAMIGKMGHDIDTCISNINKIAHRRFNGGISNLKKMIQSDIDKDNE